MHWVKVEAAYAKVAAFYDRAKDESGRDAFLMGEEPSFADFVVAGCLIWVKKLLTEQEDGWDLVRKWHGGRWEKLLEKLAPYMNED